VEFHCALLEPQKALGQCGKFLARESANQVQNGLLGNTSALPFKSYADRWKGLASLRIDGEI
jgi:hypothetical protein